MQLGYWVLVALSVTGLFAQENGADRLMGRPKNHSQEMVNKSWDVLRQGLAEGNPKHRSQALAAIGTMKDSPEALKLVGGGLQDKDTLVRQSAAAVLGEMKNPDGIPYLKQALKDTDEVAFTAATSLTKMGDFSGREVFQQVLTGERKDAPGLVGGKVREMKQKLRSPQQLALMGAREASGAVLGPASLGITVAEDALKDSGAAGRTLAADDLRKDADPYSLILLEWSLADKNWVVRAAVAKALGDRGDAGTVDKLIPLLSDDHHPVRYMAAASIIRLASKNRTDLP